MYIGKINYSQPLFRKEQRGNTRCKDCDVCVMQIFTRFGIVLFYSELVDESHYLRFIIRMTMVSLSKNSMYRKYHHDFRYMELMPERHIVSMSNHNELQ